jgi:hypothetical protein
VALPLNIPRKGKSTNGINEVAARGMHSVIHHTAINAATEASNL